MKPLAALVTLPNGDVRRVFLHKNGGNHYTIAKRLAKENRFNRWRKPFIRAWAKKRGWEVEFTKRKNPFVIYDTDTSPVNSELEKKLNLVGRDIKRKLFVGEGTRTDYQQWVFRMAYLTGRGNLAARCCLKYWPDRWHSWEDCGKQSQSNHKPGNAADTMILQSYSNIGLWNDAVKAMKKYGLGLPVYKESWHVEISDSFDGLLG